MKNFMLKILFIVGLSFIIVNCSLPKKTSRPAKPEDSLSLLYKFQEGKPLPKPVFKLNDPAINELVDYTQYGNFENAGTAQYRYVIKRGPALKETVGAGIYPNEDGVREDPEYKGLDAAGLLKGSHWDYVNNPDLQRAFYKWIYSN